MLPLAGRREGWGCLGIVDAVFLAVADAQERGVGGIDLPVEAEGLLVRRYR